MLACFTAGIPFVPGVTAGSHQPRPQGMAPCVWGGGGGAGCVQRQRTPAQAKTVKVWEGSGQGGAPGAPEGVGTRQAGRIVTGGKRTNIRIHRVGRTHLSLGTHGNANRHPV